MATLIKTDAVGSCGIKLNKCIYMFVISPKHMLCSLKQYITQILLNPTTFLCVGLFMEGEKEEWKGRGHAAARGHSTWKSVML